MMQYFITFLEGIISFISPCMLPMLPLYVSYFAGETGKKKNILFRSLSFVFGFSVMFCLLGVFAGSIGSLLIRYKTVINIICGTVVVFFGLSYLDIIPLKFLKGMKNTHEITGIFSAFLFGIVYSVSLTPCIGAFLGSAIMLASTSGSTLKGFLLLLVYSLGLGIPFVLSAILLDRLKDFFNFIKKNYKIINLVCGIFLIVVGVLMGFGLFNKFIRFI